jgi:hypothetical protein
MAERNDLKLQFRAAEKLASKPREQRRDVCERVGDTMAPTLKTLAVPHFGIFSSRRWSEHSGHPLRLVGDLAEEGVQIKGYAIDCSHVLLEERPEETIADLTALFSA